MSRLSVRMWSKGSARGAGPAVQVAAVRVQENRVGLCGWCHVWTFAPGLGHGARVALNAPKGWPECEHGRRYLASCVGQPVPPSCCAAPWRAVLLLTVLQLQARRVLA